LQALAATFALLPLVEALHHYDWVRNSLEGTPASLAVVHRKEASRFRVWGDHIVEELRIDPVLPEVCDCRAPMQVTVKKVGGEGPVWGCEIRTS